MKKYDMSMIDFSEIANVTTEIEKLQKANARMKELGIIGEDGDVDAATVKKLAGAVTVPLFGKLSRRLRRRPDAMMEIYENVSVFAERNEITAVYFYIAFLYGFLQWRVPEAVALLPADDRALSVFVTEFKNRFSEYIDGLNRNPEE